MRKRSLAMLVVAGMALPAQALAEFCFTDSANGAWSIELGQQQGAKLPIHGFRQDSDCMGNSNNVQPFTGELVVTGSESVTGGLHVNATDPSDDCYAFRVSLDIDLTNGQIEGEYMNDDGADGSIALAFSLSCPNPYEALGVPSVAAGSDPAKSED